jgi:hypothetical protein
MAPPVAPTGGTYNYTPSALRTDGATPSDRTLVSQPATSAASTIALPGKTASWTGGAATGEGVRIVEPPAQVQQASFTTPAVKTPVSSAPIEVGPMVDIMSLPNTKR